MANLYSILELPVFSDISEVKKNFKRLAFSYHPDVNKNDPNAEKKFKRINHAYQILSDERKKRRYDEILRYQLNKPRQSFSSSTPNTGRRPGPQSYRRYRRKSKTVNSKYHNFIAIGFFLIGIVVFQVISRLNEERIERNYTKTVVARNDLIEKSKKEFANGNIRSAIEILNSISMQARDKELYVLKSKYITYSDSISNELVNNNEFDSALYHLRVILDFKSRINGQVYERISQCYRRLGQTESAINLMENLIRVNPENLVGHKELAHIYQYDIGDYDRSLIHYEAATGIIVDNYVDYYGKAYIAIINPKNHPIEDANIFLEKSKIYYQLGQIDNALTASRWAGFLLPSSNESFIIQGLCWTKKGNSNKACEAFNKAKNSGEIDPQVDSLISSNC